MLLLLSVHRPTGYFLKIIWKSITLSNLLAKFQIITLAQHSFINAKTTDTVSCDFIQTTRKQ